ncbi:MAG: flavodoxin domain-containing protein [Coriobacteriales bacterium]|nr:flavodoxin domain-containing protein [Coriobacteriales bacterium]
MPSIVIYGSQYGTARQYAEELARRVDIEVRPYDAVGNVNDYDAIAYIGALYAGGVVGMRKTFAKLVNPRDKTIAIATVGLADPTDQENVKNIEDSMRRQLSSEVFESAHVFHLRGGIDYSKLGFKHKTMMRLLCSKARSIPEVERNAEVRAMLQTYGKQVSFVDFCALDPLGAVLTDVQP